MSWLMAMPFSLTGPLLLVLVMLSMLRAPAGDGLCGGAPPNHCISLTA
jgi:hypothetical protein